MRIILVKVGINGGIMVESMYQGALTALKDCLAVQKDETLLIITDPHQRDLAQIFWNVGRDLGAEALLLEMLERQHNGSEPPGSVTAAMQAAQVILAITSKSLSHTKARKQATSQGGRMASLPGLTKEMIAGALVADYATIARRSQWAADLLSRGERVEITSKAGTNLTMSIKNREGMADTGLYHNPGDFGNLPAGEAYIAPWENSAQGLLVIDGTMSGLGILDEPLVMEVVNGAVTKIEGSRGATLHNLLKDLGHEAFAIGELGIGTNDQAKLSGHVLEDEKVMGTIHLALGNNSFFGGLISVASHLDGIIKEPTLLVDDVCIIKEGVLLEG